MRVCESIMYHFNVISFGFIWYLSSGLITIVYHFIHNSVIKINFNYTLDITQKWTVRLKCDPFAFYFIELKCLVAHLNEPKNCVRPESENEIKKNL